MAGSVEGPEFSSAVVAEVLGREPADVEERLEVLERVHGMVRLVGERVWPDGVPTVRYGFVHALYQNALYATLQPSRKAAWSAAVAQSLLGHYGATSGERAADLAVFCCGGMGLKPPAPGRKPLFLRALTIARGQRAKSLELRAAMRLTRLYQQEDRHDEARPLLAESYAWFTERFDTPDLQAAKVLLEQIS
jgi:hypothetical protein